MKLEVGKSYRTRSGLRATCVADNLRGDQPCACVVHSADVDRVIRHMACGSYWPSLKEDEWDLISEWVDKPTIDWSIVPPWFNWVAMDESGVWFAYSVQPVAGRFEWLPQSQVTEPLMIHTDFAPKWTGDWKQSLVERPKV